jgi:hypothetical protein
MGVGNFFLKLSKINSDLALNPDSNILSKEMFLNAFGGIAACF